MDKDTNQWAMILHLSVFASYIVPVAGVIAPIAIWLTQKERMPGLDPHGRMVANFLISMFIYSVVAVLLCLVFIGFLLVPVLVIIGIAYPIIGALKASSGELWHYPGMIKFL